MINNSFISTGIEDIVSVKSNSGTIIIKGHYITEKGTAKMLEYEHNSYSKSFWCLSKDVGNVKRGDSVTIKTFDGAVLDMQINNIQEYDATSTLLVLGND